MIMSDNDHTGIHKYKHKGKHIHTCNKHYESKNLFYKIINEAKGKVKIDIKTFTSI